MAFEFDRYINGTLMAESVIIERQKNLADAMREAARIASRGPNGEAPVLVLRAEAAERALAERAGGVNEDALRALAQAYDREDSAQRGEPDPWNLDDPGDIGDSDTWVSERLACAQVAAEAFLSALLPEDVAGLVERLRQYEGRQWETTACYNGTRDEAATALAAKDAELAEAKTQLDCALIREGNEKHRAKIAHQNMNAEINARERAEAGERAAHDAANTAIRQRDEARAQLAEARKALANYDRWLNGRDAYIVQKGLWRL